MKFYAVKKGRKPGVYTTWDECKEQVHGYSGAEYKSFNSMNEALAYIGSSSNPIHVPVLPSTNQPITIPQFQSTNQPITIPQLTNQPIAIPQFQSTNQPITIPQLTNQPITIPQFQSTNQPITIPQLTNQPIAIPQFQSTNQPITIPQFQLTNQPIAIPKFQSMTQYHTNIIPPLAMAQTNILYVDGGQNRQTGNDAWGSVVTSNGQDIIPIYGHLLTDMKLIDVVLPVGARKVIVANFSGTTQQNNGAELLALIAGLRIALTTSNIKTIYSDSDLCVKYWSKSLGTSQRSSFDPRKVSYIDELIHLRREFEKIGGSIVKIRGEDNLADLGYH